ncbi:uncharacterized protein LOC131853067 [Achroia grisella]|uniref:uncharacterized protein LOC131853067 n=1 Tax=Achroia grisella TaxID=688607 RepID=UPI0027D2CF47|nr:uncharacterized protein LOC131853067 [Achroia grisella]
MSYNPKMGGLALGHSSNIRMAHKSTKQHVLSGPKKASKDDDAYRYMPIDGGLYELISEYMFNNTVGTALLNIDTYDINYN